MKKVLVFLLVLAIALGGIGFAHATVTDSQEELIVYPTLQVGDPGVMEGLTASMTFTCGHHLRWYTDYPFGGEAVTEFAYSREAITLPAAYQESHMDLWLSGGVSSSVSGGEFTPKTTNYGALVQAVADQTPAGGSKTMSLEMRDYVNYYLPDYELRYEDDQKECNESASLLGFAAGEQWYQNPGSYRALVDAFRFPVEPGHSMSVTVNKDDADRVVGIQLYPENGPELHFLSDVSAEGLWFVPEFRDEAGGLLPYESPEGHGIYFIPWKTTGTIRYASGDKDQVSLDVEKARRIFPLDEARLIEHMIIDAEAGTAQMLTLEDGMYMLTTCDLESGTTRSRLEVLPFDPNDPVTSATFLREGDYLLLTVQSMIALTDAAGEKLYLTAPDALDQTFNSRSYDPDTGDLRFDGETLVLTDTAWYREGTFWAAAWRQGELCFYGQYDCSLMRGNDDWYYSYITAEEYPMVLK